MKEIITKSYEAEDGLVFSTKEDCLRHERKISSIGKLINSYNEISNYCKEFSHPDHYDENGEAVGCSNIDCPFNVGGIECKFCTGLFYEIFLS